MKQIEKQQKSQIALIKVKLDLLQKGYAVFESDVDYWLPFDLVVYKDYKLYKLQVKYRANGQCSSYKSVTDSKGCRVVKYEPAAFDYYALYLPTRDCVVYPSINFRDHTITSEVPNAGTPFYWYEDFLNFTDTAEKRTYKDFGRKLHRNSLKRDSSELFTKEMLQDMLWKIPTTEIAKQFGLTDNGIARWAKKWELSKPPRGYWTKNTAA